MPFSKILISACLLGEPVRYDGKGKAVSHPLLKQWKDEGRLISHCPEVAAGLGLPRPPAEIEGGRSGDDVIAARARVIEKDGTDKTADYLAAAHTALKKAKADGCRFALLTDGSPSCGSVYIHDGIFIGHKHPGTGVTAALLRANGIEVFSENQIEHLANRLKERFYPHRL